MGIHNFVFIAKIPELNKIEVHEGEAEIIKFKDSFNLKLVPGDAQILKKICEFLKKMRINKVYLRKDTYKKTGGCRIL